MTEQGQNRQRLLSLDNYVRDVLAPAVERLRLQFEKDNPELVKQIKGEIEKEAAEELLLSRSWKITATQEIFHSPETVDSREGEIVTYICASHSVSGSHRYVEILGPVSRTNLAAALRNLADRLVQP